MLEVTEMGSMSNLGGPHAKRVSTEFGQST